MSYRPLDSERPTIAITLEIQTFIVDRISILIRLIFLLDFCKTLKQNRN